eukprot:1835304-Amphidinium_carterae.1
MQFDCKYKPVLIVKTNPLSDALLYLPKNSFKTWDNNNNNNNNNDNNNNKEEGSLQCAEAIFRNFGGAYSRHDKDGQDHHLALAETAQAAAVTTLGNRYSAASKHRPISASKSPTAW